MCLMVIAYFYKSYSIFSRDRISMKNSQEEIVEEKNITFLYVVITKGDIFVSTEVPFDSSEVSFKGENLKSTIYWNNSSVSHWYCASSSIVDAGIKWTCQAFNFETPSQRETLSSILNRVPRPVTTFTLSPPFHIYLGLLHYGHLERSFSLVFFSAGVPFG